LAAATQLLDLVCERHLTRPSVSLRSCVYRRFQRINISPRIAGRLHEARRLRRAAYRLTRAGRTMTAEDRARAAVLRARGVQMQKDAKAGALHDARRWHDARVRDLQTLRTHIAHALHKVLSRLSPLNSLISGSDERIPDSGDDKTAERLRMIDSSRP
jgi:hypothetical protein